MNRVIKYLIVTTLLTLAGVGQSFAFLVDSIPEPDTSDLITFTLLPEMDPFQSDKPMHVSLKFDMRKFIREKHKGEYHNAILSIALSSGGRVEDTIRIRSRGEFRKNHCYFPPVKLNFKESEFEETYMNDIKTLKLVTYCKNGELYQQYIFMEYLVYRMFNILTDNSYRVRLIEIKYIDSQARKPSFNKYGFIVESNNHLSLRIDAVRIDRDGIKTWQTEPYQTNLVNLFQFMIGNTDWAINNQHNVRLFKQMDHTILTPLVIPYDFDYCGMVDAYYAIPPEELGLESVRERVYLGYCLRSEADYQEYIQLFLDHKQEFFSLVENFELLYSRYRKNMVDYLEEFFDIIENPRRFKKVIIDRCRKMPTR
ncbi:hypothetical protein ACFLTA_08735 [Bacteroidota bacterium]